MINSGELLINFGALLINFGTLFDNFGAFLQFYGVSRSRITFYTRFKWFWGALFNNFHHFSRSSALSADSGATFGPSLERFGHVSPYSWFWGFLQF